jgi:hypothetical protein
MVARLHDFGYAPFMKITLDIPDELASAPFGDPSRIALEALAVEGYRTGRISAFQVRQMLGHESRWETEDFLSANGVWPGTTVAELEAEFRSLEKLRTA